MDEKIDMNDPSSEWIELNPTNNMHNRRVSKITIEANVINSESRGHSTVKID